MRVCGFDAVIVTAEHRMETPRQMWTMKQCLLGQVANKWDPRDQSKQTAVQKGTEVGRLDRKMSGATVGKGS